MRLFRITTILVLMALPAAAQDAPLRGVALVIGESTYAQLPALPNPRSDARAMDELLGDLGFDVTRVLDGDAAELRSEIAEFVADAVNADVALVYYSGHGIEVGGQNYLLATDADLATPQALGAGLVAVGDLLDDLARTVPVTIVLLDACRTNPLPAGQSIELPGSGTAVTVDGTGLGAVRGPTPLGRPDVPEDGLGVVVGFAASPGQPALDGEPGGNSPYAAALLKHFSAGGYALGDLMLLVSEEVYLNTNARQLPWVNSSLRRVLTFGEPVEADGGDEAAIREGRRELLLTIASAPAPTRRYVETVAHAEGVPLDALYGMLKVLGVETGDTQTLERQLLDGAQKLKAFMAARPGAASTDTELARLAGLGEAAQREGAIELALGFRQKASERAAELEGAVDEAEANIRSDRLQIGATYAEHARIATLNFDFPVAAEMWGRAFAQVEKWDRDLALDYKRDEASALNDLGEYEGDPAAFDRALAAYAVASGMTERGSADWAQIENDRGTALTIVGRRGDAARLREAVAAFEASLEVSDSARTRSNLGVALMELGQREQGISTLEASAMAFDEALARMTEREPFLWGGTMSNLGNVLLMLGDRTLDAGFYAEAAEAHRSALTVLKRDALPLDWAKAQGNLGNALARIGERETGTESLEGAVASFRLALEERTRERVPFDWAATEGNLGAALMTLGNRVGDAAMMREGIGALKASLEVRTRERAPVEWAFAQLNLGIALKTAGVFDEDVDLIREAVDAYRAAVDVLTDETMPVAWAQANGSLGIALMELANRAGDEQALVDAREAFADALSVFEDDPDMADYLKGRLDEIDQRLGE